MAKVLVLGGAGFIGYHLAKYLAKNSSHQVTIVDNLSRGTLDKDLHTLLDQSLSVRLHVGDLTTKEVYAELDGPFQHVYLLAGIVGVQNVATAPASVLANNTAITLNTLDWLAKVGCGRLLFASTSEAYSGSVNLGLAMVPTGEDVPLAIPEIQHPRATYALTKIFGEAAVTHFARDFKFDAIIVRLHNVYGPRMGMSHVVPELMQRLHSGMNPLPVYGLDQTRAFCYISDAVNACVSLMEMDGALGEAQIVNVGNDQEEVSIGDLVHTLSEVTGFYPETKSLPASSGGVARRCPNLGKIRALVGFRPEVGLSQGLAVTWEWYRRHLDARAASQDTAVQLES